MELYFPQCCMAALTGLIAHSGRTKDTGALCDRAIEIGVVMAEKLDRLETALPTITDEGGDGQPEHEGSVADA